MVSRLLKASSDERELTGIEKRLAQMSQRATFQILVMFYKYWYHLLEHMKASIYNLHEEVYSCIKMCSIIGGYSRRFKFSKSLRKVQ